MASTGLLVLLPVQAGPEEELRAALNAFGNDIRGVRSAAGDPRIEFGASSCLHFARFALLDDPDRGPDRKRLLFASDHDGDDQTFADELHGLTRHPEAIWGRCAGYPGATGFHRFLQSHRVEPSAYYIAFRGVSLERCRGALELRRWWEARLAEADAAEVFRAYPDLRDFVGLFRRVWEPVTGGVGVVWAVISTIGEVLHLMRIHGVAVVLDASKQINATLDRVGWIRVLNRLLRNSHPAPPHGYTQASPWAPAHPVSAGYPPEDAVMHNQLTLVTEVRPEALPRLRAVLALIDLYGRRLSPPGSLVGISTIHTVRWALIDDGKRLLMASNYDGTWENYIDEFAEMILSGLDGLWRSAPDYPVAGAQDVAALKQFLRVRQVPANVFYSAYPEASVLNVGDDLDFERWSGPIVRWLSASASRRRVSKHVGTGDGER